MDWYRNSILGKLLGPILLLVLVGFGLLAVVNGTWLYSIGWQGVSDEAREMALRASIQTEGFLGKHGRTIEALAVSEDVREFAEAAIRGGDSYRQFLSTITRIVAQDENILNIYFGSDDDQMIFDTNEWVPPTDYRVGDQGWYKEGKRANALHFATPVVDEISGQPVLPITYPVYVDGTFRGLLGMDLLLDTINKAATSIRTREGGYVFAMDREGTILIHPDSRLVFRANGTDWEGDLGALCRDMVAGKTGYGEVVFQGETQWVFYNPVPLAGWSFGVVFPKAVITAPVVQKVTVSGGISVAILILVGLLATWIVRRTIAPLRGLTLAAEQMASGDLTVVMDSVSTDELGALTNSFGGMARELRGLIGGLKGFSDDIADTSQELSASAEEAGASIEEVAASANEFASVTVEMAGNVQRMAASADHVAERASFGNEAVGKAVDETSRLHERMTDLAGQVEELGNSSEEIGRIIQVINDIADQTNLLALNAAIEAARAGELGRGFAVVAEEVRKLAEQSSEATAEICRLINRIQRETGVTVSGMKESVDQVEATFAAAKTSGELLEEILREADGLAKEIRQIAIGTEQMSSGSEEIAASTEEQSAAIQQVASASQNLSNMAQELQRVTNQFKLDQ